MRYFRLFVQIYSQVINCNSNLFQDMITDDLYKYWTTSNQALGYGVLVNWIFF